MGFLARFKSVPHYLGEVDFDYSRDDVVNALNSFSEGGILSKMPKKTEEQTVGDEKWLAFRDSHQTLRFVVIPKGVKKCLVKLEVNCNANAEEYFKDYINMLKKELEKNS